MPREKQNGRDRNAAVFVEMKELASLSAK